LESDKSYTVHIPANINSDVTAKTFTFNIFNSRSEAVKVNIAGYSTANTVKSADVYLWLGNGGVRDYASFAGTKVYIYNIDTEESEEVGTLSLWKNAAPEINHQMINSNVWNADFTGFSTAGNYRLAIEGIGCSDDFTISSYAYYEPFKVSTQGFYYMRIGEQDENISPVTRRPLYIPGKSPTNCTVHITTLQPYGTGWTGIGLWDETGAPWTSYRTGRTNPKAYGGHSDALDWDRYLGHVSIIYDMLLPYYITDGALSDDDLNITESGNGIPDVLDEARYEVDFWLRLRDGKGYSHGLNNPNNNVFHQAGTTAVAAWTNAANAAMLGDCFRISGHTELMAEYRDSAIVAYDYACGLLDQQLTRYEGIGEMRMTGRCFRATAAAFLYNLTGDTRYEDDLNEYSRCTTATSTICNPSSYNEVYAVAGYLFTNQEVHYPELYDNMKSSIIAEAKSREANYSENRPSRRSTDNSTGWFVTVIMNQRSIIAHAISEEGSDNRKLFEDALILEADFSLGRNPLNTIHMTTATTGLANKRSFENAYTSGWNDGVPGVHPGHTPYMNIYDWGSGGMIMGRPKWMVDKNYPALVYANPSRPRDGIAAGSWPYGELYYNTRYVYAANEFTPQQSMRGKQALYGYLYAISPKPESPEEKVAQPIASVPSGSTVKKNSTVTLFSNTTGARIYYTLDGSTPSATNGLKYTVPVVFTDLGNITITAIAIKKGLLESEISAFEYTVMEQVEKPVASVSSGSVKKNSTVTLSSKTVDAIIYYTLDGSEPSASNGLEYTESIVFTDLGNITIKAIADKDGMLKSEISAFEYIVMEQVEEPTASVFSGSIVEKNSTVALSTDTEGATIYYTVNGSTPSTSSLKYTEPIVITNNVTIKTIAVKENMLKSEIAVFEYIVLQTDVTSVSADPAVVVYPNPVQTGGTFYVKTNEAGVPIEIYSQSGVCVKQLVSTGKVTAITFDIQAGNYIVKIGAEETKIIVK
jgi:hypothetical protein